MRNVLIFLSLLFTVSVVHAEYRVNPDTGKRDYYQPGLVAGYLDNVREIGFQDGTTLSTGKSGLWEEDMLGDLQPVAVMATDLRWELDVNGDIQPKG